MSDIQITIEDSHAYLTAPFSRDANAEYKNLGGRWDRDRRQWKFDARDTEKIRAACRAVFGYDDQAREVVDVRVTLRDARYGGDPDEIVMFGRSIARRPGRDAEVRLGRGVTLVEGYFQGSGGSMRRPEIGDVSGVVIDVRDVPASHPDLDSPGVEIIAAPIVDRDALIAEKSRLEVRLAEINALLEQQ